MSGSREAIRLALDRIVDEISSWEGITVAPHRFGGREFRFGRGEIGHVHESGLVDVPFPKPVRDELVAAGKAQAHHILPRSGWVSFWIRVPADADAALELLGLSYDLRRKMRQRHHRPPGPPA